MYSIVVKAEKGKHIAKTEGTMLAGGSLPGNRTEPEEVPGGLDVLWELHEAVLGVDAPVDGPGRRPAAGCRRSLPDLHGERLRHGHPSSPLLCTDGNEWDLGTVSAVWMDL